MDDADRADAEIVQDQREAMLRAKAYKAPVATGRCLYCDEVLGDNERWCNREHRDEWEREERLRARGRL